PAEAGSSVTVREGSALLGTATASQAGDWVVDTPLADGSHRVYGSSVDQAGNPGAASPYRNFTVDTTPQDTTPPAAPSVTSPVAGSTNPRTVSFAGQAEPASNVRIYVSGFGVGSTTAAGSGSWLFSLRFAATGSYT